MSKIKRIAAYLHTDEDHAETFCVAVQKRCTQATDHGEILGALTRLPVDKRDIDHVVQMLHTMADQHTPANIKHGRKPKTPYFPTKRRGGFENVEDDYDFPPTLLHDPRDHIAQYKKCPHGIPTFRICAICDPEGFREYTGID